MQHGKRAHEGCAAQHGERQQHAEESHRLSKARVLRPITHASQGIILGFVPCISGLSEMSVPCSTAIDWKEAGALSTCSCSHLYKGQSCHFRQLTDSQSAACKLKLVLQRTITHSSTRGNILRADTHFRSTCNVTGQQHRHNQRVSKICTGTAQVGLLHKAHGVGRQKCHTQGSMCALLKSSGPYRRGGVVAAACNRDSYKKGHRRHRNTKRMLGPNCLICIRGRWWRACIVCNASTEFEDLKMR